MIDTSQDEKIALERHVVALAEAQHNSPEVIALREERRLLEDQVISKQQTIDELSDEKDALEVRGISAFYLPGLYRVVSG